MEILSPVSYTHLDVYKRQVSILVETEHKELAHTNHNIGIDLGIKDLCITSDGKASVSYTHLDVYKRQFQSRLV